MELSKDFNDILGRVPTDKQYIAVKIINELIFMENTLQALKKDVEEKGVVEHFQQGKQNFFRESPALKSYNAMIQRYSTLYKQLSDLMEKPVETQKSELMDFLTGVK